MMKQIMNLLPVLLLSAGVAGCAWLAPRSAPPALELPAAWPPAGGPQQPAGEAAALAGWWRSYRDPVLEQLVAEALAGSDDVLAAGARLQQARVQYAYASNNRLPLVSVGGGLGRGRLDVADSALLSDSRDRFRFLGGMLSYEVDLWGKLAAANQAARAAYFASRCNRDAVRVGVAAEAAGLYFTLRALDAEMAVLGDLVRIQEDWLRLVREQHAAGAAAEVALQQAAADLAAARAELPRLAEQRAAAETALAVLLGRSPRQIVAGRIERGRELDGLEVPLVAPGGAPAELLERRPDLAAAEGELAASNFNIGYVRAAYFPTISLYGLLGVGYLDIQNLYQGNVRTWQLGGMASGPLLDFGRTGSRVDLAFAQRQEQVVLYQAAVRTAFKEAKDALTAQEAARDAAAEEAVREAASARVLELARLRQAQGAASAFDVLAAERAHREARLAGVAARLKRLQASVGLYRALGGGWKNGEDGELARTGTDRAVPSVRAGP